MISIVMTTFNGSDYIVSQLDSIKNQTLKPDEVIISDDGSTDNTVDIIRHYIDQNSLDGWRLVENKENKGWRRNFIETTRAANGDIIFFSDQDDIWLNDKIEVMSKEMMTHPEISVLAGKYIKFTDTIPDCSTPATYTIKRVNTDKKLLKTGLPGCVYCVRKEFFDKINGFWNGIFSHDAMCWAVAKLLGELYIMERPVILWRRHDKSTYTLTGKSLKTKEERTQYVKNQIENSRCLKTVITRLRNEKIMISIVDEYLLFLSRRLNLLTTHSLGSFFWLLMHIKLYNKPKQFLLEVYLSFK